MPILREDDLHPDPIIQFRRWHDQAGTDAVTVATSGADGWPAARVVLLKGVDERGFVFFTNYGGAKAVEIDANPRAALTFHWPPERQVRVVGPVERTTGEESDAYWATRPRASQLGAWASPQSTVMGGREELESRLREVGERFEGGDVPRPTFWGGYRVRPLTIEFWHHQDDRLHDRIRYRRADGETGGGWVRERLAP